MVEEAGWSLAFSGLVKQDSNIGSTTTVNGVTVDAIRVYAMSMLGGTTASGPQEPFSVDWVAPGNQVWILGFSIRFCMRISSGYVGEIKCPQTMFVSVRESTATWGYGVMDSIIYMGPYPPVRLLSTNAPYAVDYCDVNLAAPLFLSLSEVPRLRIGVCAGNLGAGPAYEYDLTVILRTASSGWGSIQGTNHINVDSAPNPTQVVTIGNIPQVTIGNIPHVIVDSAPNPTQVVTVGNIPHVVVDSAPTPVQHVIVDNSPLPVKQSGDILVSLRQGGSS